jgi:6-phosphogluconate dehydrogenase (decarboxylating)
MIVQGFLIQLPLMANLGFLGLGLMGYPMARNLLKAGHEVSVWSNTAAKATQLASEAGAKACATPAEVAAASATPKWPKPSLPARTA